jgi:hypothetical protein
MSLCKFVGGSQYPPFFNGPISAPHYCGKTKRIK